MCSKILNSNLLLHTTAPAALAGERDVGPIGEP